MSGRSSSRQRLRQSGGFSPGDVGVERCPWRCCRRPRRRPRHRVVRPAAVSGAASSWRAFVSGALLRQSRLEVAHHGSGTGAGARHGADDVEGVVDVRPSRAWLRSARLQGFAAGFDGTTVAPSSFMRKTLGLWRFDVLGCPCTPRIPGRRRAQMVAVATRAGLRRSRQCGLAYAPASMAWPITLLILCAPVWLRFFALEKICAPPIYGWCAGRGRWARGGQQKCASSHWYSA